jgi:hypothetical protein
MKVRFLVAATLAACGLAVTPARAQGVFDMGALTNTLSLDGVTKSEKKRAAGKGGSMKDAIAGSLGAEKSGSPKTGESVGKFAYSPEVRKKSVANFVGAIRKLDPTGADRVEKEFATKDVLGMVGQKMTEYGLKPNSLADSLAVYLIVAWKAARGTNDDATKAEYQAVRDQMANALVSVPALAEATDAQKQELSDALLLQALLVDAAVTAAKGNAEQMEKVKSGIAGGVRQNFGLDLNALKLTDAGFRS